VALHVTLARSVASTPLATVKPGSCRIRIAVPLEGFGSRLDKIIARLAANCRADETVYIWPLRRHSFL
jgi:hypothetical protein